MEGPFRDLDEFWPYYLSQHRRRATRWLHFLGTTAALAGLAAAAATRDWRWAAAAPLAGYGPAWVGHAFFERNRPATWRWARLSLLADLRLYVLMWRGRL